MLLFSLSLGLAQLHLLDGLLTLRQLFVERLYPLAHLSVVVLLIAELLMRLLFLLDELLHLCLILIQLCF